MTYQEEDVNRQVVVTCVFSAWELTSQVVTRQCWWPRRGYLMLGGTMSRASCCTLRERIAFTLAGLLLQARERLTELSLPIQTS